MAALCSCCLAGFVVIIRLFEIGGVRVVRDEKANLDATLWDWRTSRPSVRQGSTSRLLGWQRGAGELSPHFTPVSLEAIPLSCSLTTPLHLLTLIESPTFSFANSPSNTLPPRKTEAPDASLERAAACIRVVQSHDCTLDFSHLHSLVSESPLPVRVNPANSTASRGQVVRRRLPLYYQLPAHIFPLSTLRAHHVRRAPRPAYCFSSTTTPAKMANKAAWITAKKAHPLQVSDAPMPKPRPGEVVIRNAAVAINPIDWKIQAFGNDLPPADPNEAT